MKEEVKCAVCGRKKTFLNEGRFIDGSWAKDKLVPEKYHNKWVCSYHCYEKLLVHFRQESKNEKRKEMRK